MEFPTPHKFCPILNAREYLGCADLEHLNLAGNCLRKAGTSDIVDIVIDLGLKLKTLSLARNELDEAAAADLARMLKSPNISLVECDISHNAFGDAGIACLADAIPRCKTLMLLNISKTCCGILGARALGQMFEKDCQVTDLDVSWNGIGGAGGVSFFEGLASSSRILRLHAQWNTFCDPNVLVALGNALSEGNSLKYLNLSQNRINDEGALVLSEALKSNSSLLDLVMVGNSLTMTGARSLQRCTEMEGDGDGQTRSIQLNNSKF